jgi:hypothetical protein
MEDITMVAHVEPSELWEVLSAYAEGDIESRVSSHIEDALDYHLSEAVSNELGSLSGEIEDMAGEAVSSLLETYIVAEKPCGVGQQFETAVAKAMGPSMTEAALEYGLNEKDVHRIVREELLAMFGPLVNALSVDVR